MQRIVNNSLCVMCAVERVQLLYLNEPDQPSLSMYPCADVIATSQKVVRNGDHSQLCVPVWQAGKMGGVLLMLYKLDMQFSKHDLELVDCLVDTIGVHLERLQLASSQPLQLPSHSN